MGQMQQMGVFVTRTNERLQTSERKIEALEATGQGSMPMAGQLDPWAAGADMDHHAEVMEAKVEALVAEFPLERRDHKDLLEYHRDCQGRWAPSAMSPRASSSTTRLRWIPGSSTMARRKLAPHGANASEAT